MRRRRLVHELVRRGLAVDDTDATALLQTGRVMVTGYPVTNPHRLVAADEPVVLARERTISRGSEKLSGALDELGLQVEGSRCLDIGAGHGGFTKVLVDRGAESVTAIDVGYGVLDATLAQDPKVHVRERTNFREVDPESLGEPFDLVVADVSFISLRRLAPNIAACTAATGAALVMVKPQFEARVQDVEPGGIVTDPEVWNRAMQAVAEALSDQGLTLVAAAPSRLPGTKGNREFFLLFERRQGSVSQQDLIGGAVEEASG